MSSAAACSRITVSLPIRMQLATSSLLSALRRFEHTAVFALGEDDGLSIGAGLVDDRIQKFHDGIRKIA